MGKKYVAISRLKLIITCFSFLVLIVNPITVFCQSGGSVNAENHSRQDINRGKRFFMGLLPFDRKYEACSSCHNIHESDTLNWNPSVYDLAVKFAGKSPEDFLQAVKQPLGKKMEAVHKNFDIPDKEIRYIKIYLDNLAQEGPEVMKPSFDNLLFFLFLGALITWALIELIFLRKIKYKMIPVVIMLVALGWQGKMIVVDAIRLGRQENYAPDQPVKFSHRIHAGQNKINCRYCHATVEYGKSAGIPAASLCMNCHMVVREGAKSGKFEIAKVVEAYETGHPIQWTRIHNLPDHVFFNHSIHVGSGKLDCTKCHGPVAEMDIMRQYSDLSMGWCVNCHRQTPVNFEINHYYDRYVKLHDALKAGRIDTIRAANIGANDCQRCHY
jgi:hypothetical protein